MASAFASLSRGALRSRAWTAVALLALGLPPFVVVARSSAYADALGIAIAARLSAVAPALPVSAEPDELEEAAEVLVPPYSEPTVRAVALDSKRSRQPVRARPAPTQGIRITTAQVLALAQRRAMPSAVFVKGNAEHPAGLLLGGVSALGVGLRDGDVLTEAAGQKATSVAQVVGIVLALRSRQASEIGGRFYRGGVPFSLTVEQPYPKPPVPG